MPFYRLTLEYDGTDFVGWQYQPNGRSVQEEVEKALKQILQCDIRIIGGGRTDAGVHARGQVASFMINKVIDCEKLKKNLNGVLPKDIVVKEARDAVEGFNARYNAKSRLYKYYIKQEPTALERNYCWQIFYDLDIDEMNKCAEQIIGEHDFRSFCKDDNNEKNTICVVNYAKWIINKKDLTFGISANRYLYGMVRALVGTMIDVGRGYTPSGKFEIILHAKDRKMAGQSAPAKGLFLEEIVY